MTPIRTKDSLLSPLADPVYRRLFAAQVTSLTGTGLGTVALVLLAYELAGGAAGAVLGTALALKMVAYIGIAPLAGAIAHRVPRKALLVALDLARAALVLLLPFVTAVWQVYALIFAISALAAGFTPLFQAVIPELLPEARRYTQALSLSRIAYELETLLSPAIAAVALTVVQFDTLFVANAATFLLSAGLVLATALPRAKVPERAAGMWENLSFGIRGYLRTPRLRGLVTVTFATALAGAMVIVNTVVYVRALLGGSEALTAAAFAASGAGAVLAALALPRVSERFGLRAVVLAGGGLAAVALSAGTLLPGLGGLFALWLLIGVAASLAQTPAGRLVAVSCREGDRPAFFAAHFSLSHLCWLVGYLLAGWLGSAAGLAATFAVAAACALIATVLGALIWPRVETGLRAPALEHEHGALEHAHLHVHDAHHRHAHEGREGPEPHAHPHEHVPVTHRHPFVIDLHHPFWPK
jgi:MFS family permease